jgi:uncharacterized protein with FMN-binding domain
MFPRRGIVALVTTALALVLLFTFKTPASPADGSTAVSGGTTGSTDVAVVSPSPTAVTPAPTDTATTEAATFTVTGSTVPTRFGDVAVQITIENGRITDVQAVALPTGRHSGEISDWSAPILASEVLQAQSANIDIVSGATYTTEAYAESVQSAIDQAAQNGVVITG